MEIKKYTNHFNWIELTMKFWKENTKVPSTFYLLFEEGLLQAEIILFAEKPSHTTVIIVDGTNRGATCMKNCQNKPLLLKGLF
jgi:hypothetical protein